MKRIVLALALSSALFSVVSPVAAADQEVSDQEVYSAEYQAYIDKITACNADKAWRIYLDNGNTDGCEQDQLEDIDLIKKEYNSGGYWLSYREFLMLW
ncbi:hypothetical protein [Bartonella ancashensis]|uniref:Uncharacterized protein n=1 Tax=Bartonella ancashensis TaxID=1318743 RepID=A0A0M4LGA6_9HYPH|nr:hypothetical protein [Bartonella ancashensis]ALE03432.1 hypothetical protein PU02_0618 [Bartonella ancashensis]